MRNLILCINLAGLILAAHLSFAETTSARKQVSNSLKAINAKDDLYKAVIALDTTAKQQAQDYDRGDTSGLLGGMPILVKDNIDVVGMATTAGSLALLNNLPKHDAPLIRQLKSNGAIILGKANLSEWANFRSEKSSSGWSAVGGQTGNAHDVSRTPCGSSAGSGVAVALGYVKVAIGTETNGSIVCPASINGVVGFKPTQSLVSGKGIVPLALSQDTAGPIADNIDNAALALAAMIDPKAENAGAVVAGLKAFNAGPPLKGMKVGVLASTRGFDVRRDVILDKAIDALKRAGVEVVDDLAIEAPDDFWDNSYSLLQYEFKRDLNHYFANREYQDPENELRNMTLAKLIKFNQDNARSELHHFDQDIFEKSQALEMTADDYQKILESGRKAAREDGLDALFNKHELNAIIGLTVGPAWKIDHVNGDAFFGPSMSSFPAIGGHPHITVPGGRIAKLPVGLSFVGKRFQDHKLAQLVFSFMKL